MSSSTLDPQQRSQAIPRLMEEDFDLLVIGGGITGAGVALDAASRGMKVALIEARDFAAGTSSRSSKLIHGGLRYLEMLDFALVREALAERHLLLTRIAPHLVKPVSFVHPLRHRIWERLYVGAGLVLYDTLAPKQPLPRHRQLTRRQALRRVPSFRRDALIGAVEYHDAQTDDARFVLTAVRTAALHGAVVARSVEATGLVRAGGRVVGITAVDRETGRTFVVSARQTVNATGVLSDRLQRSDGGRMTLGVRASKGVHLVVPRDRINSETGLILRTEKSVLFVIPWDRHWIVGTTDTDWDLDPALPAASASDVDYLLDHVNGVLSPPLERADVTGIYVGLRPLVAAGTGSTAKLSRRHAVMQPVPGLITVAGGKFTTYRIMARDAVDAADPTGAFPASCTNSTPLFGAEGVQAERNRCAALARQGGLDEEQMRRVLARYGSATQELLRLLSSRPELATPLAGGEPYLSAEVVYAVTHEGALHLEDVLARRTHLKIETADHGTESAAGVVRLMGDELGWDTERRAAELHCYLAQVEAEDSASGEPDDASAFAARQKSDDIYELITSGQEKQDMHRSRNSAAAAQPGGPVAR
ncbi:MAG: glycerol-3-phosphate dehydrogenase/oxidase [Actinomycetota bacterium]|nr:glycerol-3-phosphate dehydrogenase/oxidase [Actinomycetota bacterium]